MREHGTKTTPVFVPDDGEASWSLLQSSVSLLSGGTVQPEIHLFPYLFSLIQPLKPFATFPQIL